MKTRQQILNQIKKAKRLRDETFAEIQMGMEVLRTMCAPSNEKVFEYTLAVWEAEKEIIGQKFAFHITALEWVLGKSTAP